MAGWLQDLEAEAKQELQSLITAAVSAGYAEAKADLIPAVRQEVAKYLPDLVRAVVSASAQSAVKLAVAGEQKITQLIPGQLDNEILDPIVQTVLQDFGHLFGE